MKHIFYFLLLFQLAYYPIYAQTNLGELVIKAGQDDSYKMIDEYVKIYAQSFGATQDEGWFYTAESLKPLRFELKAVGSFIGLGSNNETYNLEKLGLENVKPKDVQETRVPTILSSGSQSPPILVNKLNQVFDAPSGIGLKGKPLPSYQFTLGLPFHTEIAVRVLATQGFNNYNTRLWGVAFKHDVKQWIPSIALAPFELALAVTYGSFTASRDIVISNQFVNNQSLIFSNKSYSIALIASKKYGALSIFGGVRLNNASSNFSMLGTYKTSIDIETLTNPVDIDYNQTQLGLSGGVRLKIGIFTFGGSANLAKYSSASVSIGTGWFK